MKFDFGWGSTPGPPGGAYSTPPDLLAGFKGPTSMRREGRGGRERKMREGSVEFHHLLLSNLTTVDRHEGLWVHISIGIICQGC